MQSEQINDLAAALVKAQGEIEGAAKSSTNPHFKSKYADLGAVWDACRGPLTNNGLAVVQMPRYFENEMRLVTRIVHSSGQWMEDDGFPLLLGKQDMQGLGSATTYARRYGLMTAVGIAPEDDDGNAAVGDGRGQKVTGSARPAVKREAPQPVTPYDRAKAWIDGRIEAVVKAKSADEINQIDHAIRTDSDALTKMNWIIENQPEWSEQFEHTVAECLERFTENGKEAAA